MIYCSSERSVYNKNASLDLQFLALAGHHFNAMLYVCLLHVLEGALGQVRLNVPQKPLCIFDTS